MDQFLVPRFSYEFLVRETWTVCHRLYGAIQMLLSSLLLLREQDAQGTYCAPTEAVHHHQWLQPRGRSSSSSLTSTTWSATCTPRDIHCISKIPAGGREGERGQVCVARGGTGANFIYRRDYRNAVNSNYLKQFGSANCRLSHMVGIYRPTAARGTPQTMRAAREWQLGKWRECLGRKEYTGLSQLGVHHRQWELPASDNWGNGGNV